MCHRIIVSFGLLASAHSDYAGIVILVSRDVMRVL